MNMVGMGATYKTPQTQTLLSTFIPPLPSVCLALAKTLPQDTEDRKFRLASDPLTKKQEASLTAFRLS